MGQKEGAHRHQGCPSHHGKGKGPETMGTPQGNRMVQSQGQHTHMPTETRQVT